MIILIIHKIVSYHQNISLIFYVKDGFHVRLWHLSCVYITAQKQYWSTKDVYTSEITFLALHHWVLLAVKNLIDFCVRAGKLLILILIKCPSLKRSNVCVSFSSVVQKFFFKWIKNAISFNILVFIQNKSFCLNWGKTVS